MSIIGSVTMNFTGQDVRDTGVDVDVAIPMNETFTVNYSDGVGANQANIMTGVLRTFTATTDVIDLTATLTDLWKTTVDAARVKAWGIANTGTASLTAGGGTDPWVGAPNETAPLQPGAFFVFATPDATAWVVTPSTANNLTVTGTVGQTYTLLLFAANA
jgi:hypothetical protein